MAACIPIVGSFCALKTNVYINQNNQQKTDENKIIIYFMYNSLIMHTYKDTRIYLFTNDI